MVPCCIVIVKSRTFVHPQNTPYSRMSTTRGVSKSSASSPASSSFPARLTCANASEAPTLSRRRRASSARVGSCRPSRSSGRRRPAPVRRCRRGRRHETPPRAGGRRGAHLRDEELAHLAASVAVAQQDRQQPGGEEQLAPGPQLRVAQPPFLLVLALLADEVHADRAPVAHEVVEQEGRRAVVLRRVVLLGGGGGAEDALRAGLAVLGAEQVAQRRRRPVRGRPRARARRRAAASRRRSARS